MQYFKCFRVTYYKTLLRKNVQGFVLFMFYVTSSITLIFMQNQPSCSILPFRFCHVVEVPLLIFKTLKFYYQFYNLWTLKFYSLDIQDLFDLIIQLSEINYKLNDMISILPLMNNKNWKIQKNASNFNHNNN